MFRTGGGKATHFSRGSRRSRHGLRAHDACADAGARGSVRMQRNVRQLPILRHGWLWLPRVLGGREGGLPAGALRGAGRGRGRLPQPVGVRRPPRAPAHALADPLHLRRLHRGGHERLPDCTGSSRRRRDSFTGLAEYRCTDCETGKFGVANCDDCMEDDAMYLSASAEAGDTTISTNKDTDLGGFTVSLGDSFTIAKCCCESASDHGTFTVAGVNAPGEYSISPLSMDFSQFDRVTRTCSSTDGVGYPTFFPCACGVYVCNANEKCDIDLNDGCGGCTPTGEPEPTPAPTVSARGDPHLVNLNGEHFDVNHGGEFTLLRIPQSTIKPAEVELKASILPEHGKPCTTYITEVELTGSWLGGKVLQVRSYLRSHADNETDKFLGLRVLDRTPGAPAGEAPWEKLSQWADTSYVVSEPQTKDGFGVTMSTAKWHSNKDAREDVPTVAGQVEIQMTNKLLSSEPTKFVIRQDLPRQEHLNLAVRRLSSLGRADVGGLLGFDTHPESLEDVTPEC